MRALNAVFKNLLPALICCTLIKSHPCIFGITIALMNVKPNYALKNILDTDNSITQKYMIEYVTFFTNHMNNNQL